MSNSESCRSSWYSLISSLENNGNRDYSLWPYSLEICNTIKNLHKQGGTKFEYEGAQKAFEELKKSFEEQIAKAKERGDENSKKTIQELESKKKDLEKKNKEDELKIETLESQNYKQGVGLGLGIPAAGAAGAGAVIGLPLLVKLLKGVFTRS